MSHTPTEAAGLWCPLVRDHRHPDQQCRADACAMWRWVPSNEVRIVDGRDRPMPPSRGYCGLAGHVGALP